MKKLEMFSITSSYDELQREHIKALEKYIELLKKHIIELEENIRLCVENEKGEKRSESSENMKYYTVRRVASINGVSIKKFNKRRLKKTSMAMEHEIEKAFDANDGDVNAYHVDVWRHEYPELVYGR
jgi:hypothetical protein